MDSLFRFFDHKYEVVLFEKIKYFCCNGRDDEKSLNTRLSRNFFNMFSMWL